MVKTETGPRKMGCDAYDGIAIEIKTAGATGLQPAASCVTGRRSNQLNYAPAWDTLLLSSDIARFPLDVLPFPAVPSDRAVTGQQRDVTD